MSETKVERQQRTITRRLGAAVCLVSITWAEQHLCAKLDRALRALKKESGKDRERAASSVYLLAYLVTELRRGLEALLGRDAPKSVAHFRITPGWALFGAMTTWLYSELHLKRVSLSSFFTNRPAITQRPSPIRKRLAISRRQLQAIEDAFSADRAKWNSSPENGVSRVAEIDKAIRQAVASAPEPMDTTRVRADIAHKLAPITNALSGLPLVRILGLCIAFRLIALPTVNVERHDINFEATGVVNSLMTSAKQRMVANWLATASSYQSDRYWQRARHLVVKRVGEWVWQRGTIGTRPVGDPTAFRTNSYEMAGELLIELRRLVARPPDVYQRKSAAALARYENRLWNSFATPDKRNLFRVRGPPDLDASNISDVLVLALPVRAISLRAALNLPSIATSSALMYAVNSRMTEQQWDLAVPIRGWSTREGVKIPPNGKFLASGELKKLWRFPIERYPGATNQVFGLISVSASNSDQAVRKGTQLLRPDVAAMCLLGNMPPGQVGTHAFVRCVNRRAWVSVRAVEGPPHHHEMDAEALATLSQLSTILQSGRFDPRYRARLAPALELYVRYRQSTAAPDRYLFLWLTLETLFTRLRVDKGLPDNASTFERVAHRAALLIAPTSRERGMEFGTHRWVRILELYVLYRLRNRIAHEGESNPPVDAEFIKRCELLVEEVLLNLTWNAVWFRPQRVEQLLAWRAHVYPDARKCRA